MTGWLNAKLKNEFAAFTVPVKQVSVTATWIIQRPKIHEKDDITFGGSEMKPF
jgi:hypothetical protein